MSAAMESSREIESLTFVSGVSTLSEGNSRPSGPVGKSYHAWRRSESEGIIGGGMLLLAVNRLEHLTGSRSSLNEKEVHG